MERRQFLGWISVGMLASSLPIALAACSPASESNPDETAAPPVDENGFQALATVDQLAEGPVLDKTSAASPVLILRDPATAAVVALNPTCTHEGCTVALKTETGLLVCPCHDAEFKLDGSIVSGPVKEPLPVYESREEGDQILVKVG